jgi:hypothetical protein
VLIGCRRSLVTLFDKLNTEELQKGSELGELITEMHQNWYCTKSLSSCSRILHSVSETTLVEKLEKF